MEEQEQRPEDYLSFAVILLLIFTFPVWITPLFEVLYALFEATGIRQSRMQSVAILASATIVCVALFFYERRKHPEKFAPVQLTHQERIKKRRLFSGYMKLRFIIIAVATFAFLILRSGGPDSYFYIRNLHIYWLIFVMPPIVGIASDLYVLWLLKKMALKDQEDGKSEAN